MASSPRSASASAPSVPEWRYDVFLSFRGADTRKGIVSHLHHELQKTGGIRTFKDDDGGLEVGAPISPSLLKAIEQSRFGIVILSSNYASSAWCLDELVHIFRCMEGQDRILPLFYDVNPSDVRYQNGSFQVALANHQKHSHDPKRVEEWRVALTKLANLSGWHTKNFRSDRELVQHIVEFICSKGEEGGSDKRHGSYGGTSGADLYGGTSGPYWDDGVYHGVREITVTSGGCIDSIHVVYDKDGEFVNAQWHGGEGPNRHKVTLDYPDEFLVSVRGHYKTAKAAWGCGQVVVIHSLKFGTNRRTVGPFGDEVGTFFSFKVEDGCHIVGMKGRSAGLLDAIGFHISHAPHRELLPGIEESLNGELEEGSSDKEHESHGGTDGADLYGGTTEAYWDDGVYHGVREITVTYAGCIDSIQVVYDKDGELVNAQRHGGDGGWYTKEVKLDYPDEFLVSVRGKYKNAKAVWGWGQGVVIHSLEFGTNRRTVGPFGDEVGTPFSFTVEDGCQIVGMKGRSGGLLNAIGFHISRAPNTELLPAVEESLKRSWPRRLLTSVFRCESEGDYGLPR